MVLGDQTSEGLEAIKDDLIKTLVLAYFDSKTDHIMQGDRSMKGLYAVLLQKGRPVNFCIQNIDTSRNRVFQH